MTLWREQIRVPRHRRQPLELIIRPLNPAQREEETAPPTGVTATTTRTRRRSTGARRRASTVSRIFTPTTPELTSPVSPFPPTTAITVPLTTGTIDTIQESPPASPAQSLDEVPLNGRLLEDDVDDIEKDHDVDAHVRRVLKHQSKKDKAKEMLRGLWTFVKTPMGFITAIYGFLVVFWGAAIVLFLLGWIPTNSKNTQDIWVEISSQVVNGLFTVTGVGLIPWRATDTYRRSEHYWPSELTTGMYIIWKLRRRIVKQRAEQGFDPVEDPNDIPDPKDVAEYVSVLNEKEQQQLIHQQAKFAVSQVSARRDGEVLAHPRHGIVPTLLKRTKPSRSPGLCGTPS